MLMMAKENRNMMNIDQNFLKYPFHESSNHRSTTSYKPSKYDDKTLTKENGRVTQEYHQDISPKSLNNNNNNKLSANSLSSTTATRNVANNYSNMNGIGSGQKFRKFSNSYLTTIDGSSTANIAPGLNQISSTNQTAADVISNGNRRGQHYMANISAASNTMPNLMSGHKQPLLNLSMLESMNVQTSPVNVNHESTRVGGQILSTTTTPQHSKVNHQSSLNVSTNLVPFCSENFCRNGIGELLASLALMCILSLLMASLALSFIQRFNSISLSSGNGEQTTSSNHMNTSNKHRIVNIQFNQRIVSNAKEYMKVFQISVSLSTLTIALDLCCLFVCCIQFLSIIKLLKTPFGVRRSFEFIKKTSHIRIISIGAFLVSIPIFFTGVILYTFVNFDEIPALITSIIIGIGIIFCGVASVQNVYLWQWEKTKASQDMQLSYQQQQQQQQLNQQHQSSFMYGNGQTSGNSAVYPLELSTLV